MGKQNTTLKYLNSNEKIWVEEKMLVYQVRAGPTFKPFRRLLAKSGREICGNKSCKKTSKRFYEGGDKGIDRKWWSLCHKMWALSNTCQVFYVSSLCVESIAHSAITPLLSDFPSRCFETINCTAQYQSVISILSQVKLKADATQAWN